MKNGNSNPSCLLFRAHKPVSRTPAFDHARAVAVRTPLNDFETLKKLLLWLQTEEECYYLKKLVNTHVRHPSHLCNTFHLPKAPQVNFKEFICSSDYQRMERSIARASHVCKATHMDPFSRHLFKYSIKVPQSTAVSSTRYQETNAVTSPSFPLHHPLCS